MAKMKTPKKKEVKEYFKDAKEIESLQYFKFEGVNDLFYSSDAWFCCDDNLDSREIWNPEKGYAKILSYKEPKEKTYKITREQILKYNMKDEFPEVFETKLTVGRWYWRYNKKELAVWNSGKDTYGFNSSFQFLEHYSFTDIDSEPTEATNQEVEEALIKEAVRRGFKEGVCVKNHQGTNVLKSLKIVYTDKYNNGIYSENQGPGVWIFMNGVWSDIIPTITKQEAEQKLNCKII